MKIIKIFLKVYIKMKQRTIKFCDIEIKKQKFHQHKDLLQ